MTIDELTRAPATEPVAPPAPAVVSGPLAGDPTLLGLPSFLAGATALAIALLGYVSPASQGGILPIAITSTGLGLLIAAIWAAAIGQSALAGIFAVFFGFWLSFDALQLGLVHGWYGVAAADVPHTVALFLIAWLVIIGCLILGTLRLPLAFTAVFVLVELAVALVLVATLQTSDTANKVAGWVILAFVAIGCYLFISALSAATGGKAYPAGKPLIRS